MLQLGYYEALGGWSYINDSPRKLQAVTAQDIQRVAGKYFEWSNRGVAIYQRKAGSAAEDPELAEFNAQEKAFIRQFTDKLKEYGRQEVEALIPRMQAQAAQVPPQLAKMFNYTLKKAQERLKELDAAEQ
jgi:hypothetical protein